MAPNSNFQSQSITVSPTAPDSRADAYIAAIATAAPLKVPAKHFAQVMRRHRENRGISSKQIAAFEKIFAGTGITTMNYSAYSFHEGTDRATVVKQGKAAGEPGPGERDIAYVDYSRSERGIIFQHYAYELALEAAKNALSKYHGSLNDITHVVTTCTSGWHEPGIACHLIHELGLSLNTQKIELNYNGCFTGLACIRTARDIVRAGGNVTDRRVVLVVATEVTSVQYSADADDIESLVALSLFGDGSGATIIAPEGEWLLSSSGSSLVPESRHLLTMKPHQDPGKKDNSCYVMGLNPNVPKAIGGYFANGYGSHLLDNMTKHLESVDGTMPEVACHPGGPKILDAIKLTLDSRGFPSDALDRSYKTLQTNGNLGSAAVLFVLEEVLNNTDRDEIFSFAFGPGVTVEWGHLCRRGNNMNIAAAQ